MFIIIRRFTLLFFAVCVNFLFANITAAGIPVSERDALIAIYKSTDGDNWRNKEGWLGNPGTECSWYGVVCNDSGDSVKELYLGWNNLKGSIPKETGSLLNLETLIFSDWYLNGEFPSELGKLTKLKTLILSSEDSRFSGQIPAEFGNLKNLVRFYIIGSRLSGPIPPELGNLSSLEVLCLMNSNLSGPIPPDIYKLTNLEVLNLSGNKLTGKILPGIGNLKYLRLLALDSNALDGYIPEEFSKLTNLKYLYLNLSDSVPANIKSILSHYQPECKKNTDAAVIPDRFHDVSISGIHLEYPESTVSILGNPSEALDPSHPPMAEPVYRYVNPSRTELITLIKYPGAPRYTISMVEVTEIKRKRKLPVFKGSEGSFVTGKGIRIGMTSKQVIERLGPPTGICKHESEDKPGLSDNSSSSYLTLCYNTPLDTAEHRMPLYHAEYLFENDRLKEFTFGYPYP